MIFLRKTHHFHLKRRLFSTNIKEKPRKVIAKTAFDNGKTLCIETGEYARLCDGSAVAHLGNTSVLVTAVSKAKGGSPPSFMPLTVDYRQKYAAAGRIPSNFLRREFAPTEKEILTSRLIDRSVRPLFPSKYTSDTQLSCQLLAVDSVYEPDVVSINAASAALSLSDIPWDGPVGAVRLGMIDGEICLFPTRKELTQSDLNLVITATQNNLVVMMEGGGNNVLQQDLMKAIKYGVKQCQLIVNSVKQLSIDVGKHKREIVSSFSTNQELMNAAKSLSETRLKCIFTDSSLDKLSRDNAVSSVRNDILLKLLESFPGTDYSTLNEAFSVVTKEIFRELIFLEGKRCDGRELSDMRPIRCEVGIFRPLHGSSVFERGQTQVQCTVAFDAPESIARIDPLLELTGGTKDKNFLLHYSFPSFATNEVSKGGPITRREVGHGALAERALRPLLPHDSPFAVLLTSTVLESNGSSSMATVCGGSLALLDAGVKLLQPAAGVAIGLVTKTSQNGDVEDYRILTDILGIEDYMGDMDFKMAGTKKGITALQADIKLPGIPLRIVMEAIKAGSEAKVKILQIMSQVISAPNEKQENVPKIEQMEIQIHKRGKLIGIGGINIKRIQSQTGAQLSWREDGILSIFASNENVMNEVKEVLSELLDDNEPILEFGSICAARIVEIRDQGVMVTLYDNMTPVLLHNSQLDIRKIHHPSALGLEIGQHIKVKYFGRDPNSGHMRLSRRALQATNSVMTNIKTDSVEEIR